jgi:hypothetical protein
MFRRMPPRPALVLFILAASPIFAERVHAQAWLSPKGEASLSIGYGNVFIKGHLFGNGQTFDDGHMRTNTLSLNLDYAISDRFTFDFAVPYVSSKYYATRSAYFGPDPHVAPDGTTIDDGQYHGTFQDFQFALRWGALTRPIVLTPYVAAIIPSRDYRYFAHSAAGRDLRQYLLGFFAARRLDPFLENGYVQFRYSYAFVEKVLGISHDLSSADLNLGYYLTPAIGVRGILSYGYTHGGLSIPDLTTPAGNDEFVRRFCDPVLQCFPGDTTPAWVHHDQITHDVYLYAGAGVSYALTGAVDVYVNYFGSVMGQNGHKIRNGLGLGFTWNFAPSQVIRQVFASRKAERPAPTSP